jgi:TonB-dependent receptor
MIEGGTGGQIDLRTKMPFDFDAGLQLHGSAEANYGDVSDELSPSASVLVSNRWDTPIGEIGVLVDLAYSNLKQEAHFIRMEPYYRTAVRDGEGFRDVFVPGGFDYGFDRFERTRNGAYLGLQWQPTDDLTISQTAFYSRYETEGNGMGIFATATQGYWGYGDWGNGPMIHGGAADGGTDGLGVDPTVSTFDANGFLVSTPSVFVRDPNTWEPTGVIKAGGNSGYSDGTSWTLDLSTSFEWAATDRLAIRGAVQFVESEYGRRGYDVFPAMDLPGSYSLDLTGEFPEVVFSNAPLLDDPANTRWAAHMPARQKNKGDEKAVNLDADYTISEEGFFRTARAGVRYAERTERDASYYGWTNLCQTWDGCDFSTHTFATAQSGDVQRQEFDDFFRGDTNLPAGVWMPSLALASRLDPTAVDEQYGINSTNEDVIAHNSFNFVPRDRLEHEANNSAGYLMLRYGGSIGSALPFDGNVGVRVVRLEHSGTGYYDQTGLFRTEGDERVSLTDIVGAVDGAQEISDGTTHTRGLPSFNLRLRPTETFQMRFAYNVTMDQPSFYDLRATGSVSPRIVNDVWDGTFTSDAGNPQLSPVISKNSDISVEWYPTQSTAAHVSLFHKTLEDPLIYSTDTKPVRVLLEDGSFAFVTASSTETHNATEDATIKGAEFGVRTFFDRLPSPWNGFGVEANYTYIDSKNPGDVYFDIDGESHSDAPVRGLSENTYNVQLMFEKPKFSARLAWNWRSEYLLSTNANGTNGSYNYLPTPNLGPDNTGAAVFKDFSLPIYSDKYGQLDFGATYRPTEQLALSLDFRNLLDEISETFMTGYPNAATGKSDAKLIRSWFISDRRITLGARYSF